MADKHLRRRAVEQLTGLSRSTIYAKLDRKSRYHDPSFPKPVKLGLRAIGWSEAAVDQWLKSRSQGAV